TSFSRDWSSDVCSSDLRRRHRGRLGRSARGHRKDDRNPSSRAGPHVEMAGQMDGPRLAPLAGIETRKAQSLSRSEMARPRRRARPRSDALAPPRPACLRLLARRPRLFQRRAQTLGLSAAPSGFATRPRRDDRLVPRSALAPCAYEIGRAPYARFDAYRTGFTLPITMIVKREDLERHLEELRREIHDPRLGLYGPDTLSWTIGREAIVFLG